MTKVVYKIAKRAEWSDAATRGAYSGSADDLRDGFIHLSAGHQVRGTLEKHFKYEADLVLIAFEEEKLGPDLRWEQSRGGESFPHLYGALPVDAALWQRPLTLGSDGTPHVDETWLAC
jgi:uncharacterized protein (DUF952 family)